MWHGTQAYSIIRKKFNRHGGNLAGNHFLVTFLGTPTTQISKIRFDCITIKGKFVAGICRMRTWLGGVRGERW